MLCGYGYGGIVRYGLVWYGIVRCFVVMGMEVWYSMVSSNQADNLLPVTGEWQP